MSPETAKDRSGWLRDLASADEELRRRAVKAIGEMGDAGLLPELVAATGDPSWRVRKEASEAVGSFDSRVAVPLLIPGLRDGGNAGRRNTTVETLIRFGPVALPSMAPLLRDGEADVRKFTVDILGGIEAPESVSLLTEALQDPDENVAAAAAEYLGVKKDRRALGPLLKILETKTFWLKFSALRAIGELADERQEKDILGFLGDPSLRLEVIEVLARIGGEISFRRLLEDYPVSGRREQTAIMEALVAILFRACNTGGGAGEILIGHLSSSGLKGEFETRLCRMIRETQGEERWMVIRAAACSPSAALLDALIGVLEFSEEEERVEICQVIAQFPEEHLYHLFGYLGSESTIIRRKAASIFGLRRFQAALPRILPLVGDEDGHVRASVALALGHIGDKAAIMPLCNLLSESYPDVREAAVAALTEMSASDEIVGAMVREIVTSSLEAGKEAVTEGSLLVLGNLVDPSTTPVFTRFLKDARARVRRAALGGLGKLRTPQAMEVILTALTDEDPDIRLETIKHLGHFRSGRCREAVMAMVHDEDNHVAAEALRVLGAFGGEDVLPVLTHAARQGAGLRQLAAIRTLAAVGGAKEREVLVGLLPTVATEARREIVTSLGKAGDPSSLPQLLTSLQDDDWSVRLAAVEAIGLIADAEAIRLLREKFHPREKDPLVRRAMETVFGRGE